MKRELTCAVRRTFLYHVVRNRQNIRAILFFSFRIVSRVRIQATVKCLLGTTSSLQITQQCSNWPILRRLELWLWSKHPCQNFEFNCSVFLSKCWRIILKQSGHLFRHFYAICVKLSWFNVDPLRLMIWQRYRRRSRRHWCLFRSCFNNKFSCTVFDAVLLGFFSHFLHVLVNSVHDHDPGTSSIAKWVVHDLDSVTALMITNCYLHSWTDLRVSTDPTLLRKKLSW